MRRFEDPEGRAWDVVIGRESWGAHYALFVPGGRGTDEPVRQAPLDATGHGEAEAALATMNDGEIARLFERSEPKHD